MTKLNPQTMKNQYDNQYDTFCRKNHDYGNSFEESLDQFGIVASIVRMSDKMKRLESLTDESKTQKVGSESLLDTLEDLSNYAAMTACWLRGIREEDGDKDTVYAEDIPPRPMEIPEAVKQLWEAQKQQVDYLFAANNNKEDEKVDSFNPEFLNMAKTCLNDLFDNIIICRDQNIPLPKRLTYCSYREEKYEQIAALVLTGDIDFGEVSRVVNDYPNLRVAEKNHLLQSIVSAAYKISDEPENKKPEFLNKKFHIPDDILEDFKEPEEEPERKRTVLGMIFPFRL
jgi:phage protein|nr:MAG TPA: Nucleotide modification associated domain 1 [Caudoviricetes sp.]